jgi:phosphoribosyl-ATP pyrophosphohydrolase
MSDVLAKLEDRIILRQKEQAESSYVAKLHRQGIARMAQKVGEEGVETAIAAVTGDKEALVQECADLVFHALVLLAACEVPFQAVEEELLHRMEK